MTSSLDQTRASRVVLVYRLQDSTLSIDSTPTRKRDNHVSITFGTGRTGDAPTFFRLLILAPVDGYLQISKTGKPILGGDCVESERLVHNSSAASPRVPTCYHQTTLTDNYREGNFRCSFFLERLPSYRPTSLLAQRLS